MKPLKWTDPAVGDIRIINRYLSSEADPQIAIDILSQILERSEILLDFPKIGSLLPGTATRSILVGRTGYRIIYRILNDEIQILRLRHGRENWRPAE